MKKIIFCFSIVLCSLISFSQGRFTVSKELSKSRMMQDINILAHDTFYGREAGSWYELKARDYLVERMKQIGLAPYFGHENYFQAFYWNEYLYYAPDNVLMVNDSLIRNTYESGKSFYPVAFSNIGKAKGVLMEYNEQPSFYEDSSNMKAFENKIAVVDISDIVSLPQQTPESLYRKLSQKADLIISSGVKGIIFISSEQGYDLPEINFDHNLEQKEVPIIYFKGHKDFLFKRPYNFCKIDLVQWPYASYASYNIGGFIDNHAKKTIIIGAHYDHVGLEIKSENVAEVVNGADDNASGTAAVLEMATRLMDSKDSFFNYLFLLFSAEEKGLFGSKHFVTTDDFNRKNTLCMINMDMVGRMDTNLPLLKIYGSRTAREWNALIDSNHFDYGKIEKIPPSIGLSDQHAFYKKRVPVLFFFSGLHKDYHTPADDANKINADGMEAIVSYTENLTKALGNTSKLHYHRVGMIPVIKAYVEEISEMVKIESQRQ